MFTGAGSAWPSVSQTTYMIKLGNIQRLRNAIVIFIGQILCFDFCGGRGHHLRMTWSAYLNNLIGTIRRSNTWRLSHSVTLFCLVRVRQKQTKTKTRAKWFENSKRNETKKKIKTKTIHGGSLKAIAWHDTHCQDNCLVVYPFQSPVAEFKFKLKLVVIAGVGVYRLNLAWLSFALHITLSFH